MVDVNRKKKQCFNIKFRASYVNTLFTYDLLYVV